MSSGVTINIGLKEGMEGMEMVANRETVGVVWTNRGELLVYEDGRLTSLSIVVLGVICALNSKRSHPPLFPLEKKSFYA